MRVVIGAGGHAKVLVTALLCLHHKPDFLTDTDPALQMSNIHGILINKPENIPLDAKLINGIGHLKTRINIYKDFSAQGYKFTGVIHPSAVVTGQVEFGDGVQIMAGAVVQSHTYLGNNVLINTRASVDHDCYIDDHTHIAPGVIVCGGVKIGKECFIGAGTTIIQNISIADNSFIPAGSIITEDICPSKKVIN